MVTDVEDTTRYVVRLGSLIGSGKLENGLGGQVYVPAAFIKPCIKDSTLYMQQRVLPAIPKHSITPNDG